MGHNVGAECPIQLSCFHILMTDFFMEQNSIADLYLLYESQHVLLTQQQYADSVSSCGR